MKNQVFWPTYKDLKEAYEFKSAATSPVRFLKAYEHASHHSEPFPSTGKKIEHPLNKISDPIKANFLVPGGRFILTFQYRSVSMWDMVPQTEDGNIVQLHRVVSQDIEVESILAKCVVASTRIRCLLVIETPYWYV